jgi:hypothetical protein
MKYIITVILLLAMLAACGPSEEEIALRKKVKNDSLNLADQEELLKQQEKTSEQSILKEQLLLMQLEKVTERLSKYEQVEDDGFEDSWIKTKRKNNSN